MKYYIDVDNDKTADYHLSFGPYWYEPTSGAVRPDAGDEIIIIGSKWGYEQDFPTIMVYEINGLNWRNPVDGGMHGWDGKYFWGSMQNEVVVTGLILIDSTYYYKIFYLDENDDRIPEYMLNFGPPWYVLQNDSLLPTENETITVTGALHDWMLLQTPAIMVYAINGTSWRDSVGPPPWSGNWIYRNSSDTSFVLCPTDSLDWMSHPPGSMMGMMTGGGMFPDSVYCQFEELYPDFLPGSHDSTIFAGYYMNMYNPHGETMMSGMGMMGGDGMMRFNQPTFHQFHYEDDQLTVMNLTENNISVPKRILLHFKAMR